VLRENDVEFEAQPSVEALGLDSGKPAALAVLVIGVAVASALAVAFSFDSHFENLPNQSTDFNGKAPRMAALAASSVTFKYSPVEDMDLCPRYWRTFSIPAL
jgi:hypothetical protein